MAGKYRFVVAALLFLAGTLNYMDRAAIGILAPYMQKDLGLDAAAPQRPEQFCAARGDVGQGNLRADICSNRRQLWRKYSAGRLWIVLPAWLPWFWLDTGVGSGAWVPA